VGVGLRGLVEVGGGFLDLVECEVTDSTAQQRFGPLRRQAVRCRKIIDRKLVLLCTLIEQAAVVQALGIVGIDRDALSNSASASSVLPDRASAWPRIVEACASSTLVAVEAAFDVVSLSGSGDRDPRLIEQPPIAIAINAIGAHEHRPKREAPEKT